MARTTIRTEDITDSEVTTAKMATDPTNASNLASGTVGSARMGSGTASSSTILYGDGTWKAEPSTDTSGLQDDIAILGFKVAANGSLSKYNLVDQTIDAFEDASGIDAGASTGETRNASNYYSGSALITPTTTGGSNATDGLYTVTSFTGDGSYTFTTDTAQTYDLLVIAGGGGASADGGGGAGAGGLRYITSHSVAANTSPGYTVVVGAGGDGERAGADPLGPRTVQSGTDSSISGTGIVTVAGTGGGKSGSTGGSGGSTWGQYSGSAGNAGGYSPVEGYAGGDGDGTTGNREGGGGGGAGGVGSQGTYSNGAAGGNGVANSITGASVTYAGGGGGGAHMRGSGGAGGSGGGGTGANFQSLSTGNASGYGSGGGGGGGQSGSYSGRGGSGSDGIVILRRLTIHEEYNDMTLISNSTTAEAVPTKGDLVMTYTNGAGTASIGDGTNGDIRAFVSRDDGTTYTQFTLADEGDTGGHIILTAHDLDISTQPSDTSMLYKITTHNQSASLETRIQAVSLGWS